jgi:serine protease Do
MWRFESGSAPRGLAIGLLAGMSMLFGACSDRQPARSDAAAVPPDPAIARAVPTGVAASSLPNFAPLVAANGKAVVNVQVVQQRKETASQSPSSDDDPYSDFYRRFGIPAPERGPRGAPPPPMRGEGSGFIVTPDGYILTNAHVVADADEVTIRLTDRREFKAKVIGADLRTDVAVVKIDAKNLPTTRLGDPTKLRTGEWVLAIGSPFGLENSATAGIVSATARAVGGESSLPFIQTDVAVNPGNSGGPLFNMQGEVIGINSMIFSATGGYMGLSFAIPIDVATNVRDQLIKTGRVVHGRIGVGAQDVTAQLAQSFGLDRPRGALVSAVEGDSPAKAAGIQAGDIILQVNGRDIERSGDLAAAITRLKPGNEVKLRVWRENKERELVVRVGELKQESGRVAGRAADDESDARLGIAVRPLNPEEKKQVDTTGNIVVERVDGAAALAGVQPGDIILGINGRPIESVKQLRAAVKDAKNSVALLVQRGDDQIFIPLRVG